MANVITYGTYDLFHVGHLRLLQRARELAGPDGTLTVVVSSDRFNWVEKHKKCAIPDVQRAEIVGAHIPTFLDYYESTDVPSLTRKIRSIAAFKGIGSPITSTGVFDMQSRYIQSDIEISLMYIAKLARKYGTPIETMDCIMLAFNSTREML